MKKHRRKRPEGRKIYSITKLLEKQPKALQKDPRYKLIMESLHQDPRILSRSFNRRCYSLLHEGVIKEEHLENFYRTYRLPRHPFFSLFFAMKRDYLNQRKEKALERASYIKNRMNQLPPYITESLKGLIVLEKKIRATDKAPFFQASIYPRSKKKADQYTAFTHNQWILFFETTLEKFSARYSDISEETLDRIKAGLILQCPAQSSLTKEERKTISRRYREFSKQYHPDAGGDPLFFHRIKWARDLLLHE